MINVLLCGGYRHGTFAQVPDEVPSLVKCPLPCDLAPRLLVDLDEDREIRIEEYRLVGFQAERMGRLVKREAYVLVGTPESGYADLFRDAIERADRYFQKLQAYENLFRLYRFAPTGDPRFQGKAGEYLIQEFHLRRAQLPDGVHSAISKKLGWES